MLTCIHAAGPISVSDLAAATGITGTTVSQTLRHLRASGTVAAERDGRVIRYRLADSAIAALLSHSPGQPQPASTAPVTAGYATWLTQPHPGDARHELAP